MTKQDIFKEHSNIDKLYIKKEIEVAIEEKFNLLNKIEYYARRVFNKSIEPLYIKVFKRLSDKNKTVELEPSTNGKLCDFYNSEQHIYTKEFMTTDFVFENNEVSKLDNDEVIKHLNSSNSIRDFIQNIKIKNARIVVNESNQ